MKKYFQPILTTHVANIALNKAIALPFLLSQPQNTHGLTDYSGESYTNDKLQVALWMIYEFMGSDENPPVKPWVELPEWEMPMGAMDGAETMTEFEPLLKVIKKEAKDAGDLWDKKNQKGISFLSKIVAQVHECVWYTNQRLTAILVCHKMGPAGENNPEAIFDGGPALADKIMSNPMAMIGGYLMVKNEFNSKKILAKGLLNIILSFLVDKAIQEGYTTLVEEPAK